MSLMVGRATKSMPAVEQATRIGCLVRRREREEGRDMIGCIPPMSNLGIASIETGWFALSPPRSGLRTVVLALPHLTT
jgi:hypothetical protein